MSEVPTLFNALARRWGEWLAQGALVHAIRTEPGVRSLLASSAGRNVPADECPKVIEEDSETRSGWRCDVVVRWKGVAPVRLELKLDCCLSSAQIAAIEEEEMTALVVPSAKRGYAGQIAPSVPVVTWASLAEVTGDETLRRLLREADASVAQAVELLEQATATSEMKEYVEAGGEGARLAGFLSALDSELAGAAEGSYESSPGWSCSPNCSYYGYFFLWTSPDGSASRAWVGFYLENGQTTLWVERITPHDEAPVRCDDGHWTTSRAAVEIVKWLRATE